MSWFHKHDLVLVARTYAPPLQLTELEGGRPELVERLAMGVTTLVWKCSDKTCDKIVKIEALGKE